jgi:hypothetical protein
VASGRGLAPMVVADIKRSSPGSRLRPRKPVRLPALAPPFFRPLPHTGAAELQHDLGFLVFPRPGIFLDSALGTFDVENVLKERMHVQPEETRFRGVRRSPKSSELSRQEGSSESFWKPAVVFHRTWVVGATSAPNNARRLRRDCR